MAKNKNQAAAKPITEDKADVLGYFEGKAEEAVKAKKENSPAPKVDISGTIKGKIIKDFGFLKKGQVQNFSHTAFAIYDKAGIIEKL